MSDDSSGPQRRYGQQSSTVVIMGRPSTIRGHMAAGSG
jgi:hypothetical protein